MSGMTMMNGHSLPPVQYIDLTVEEFIKESIRKLEDLEDDAFIVTDLSEIQERYEKWVGAFPNIQPFFALKAQDHYLTRMLLAANGCGFDVASIGEIRSVMEVGVSPENIIYGQPYKQPSHLVFALKHGLTSVCDTVDEIKKIGELSSKLGLKKTPKILLRILPDDKEGDIKGKLSSKFGASRASLPELAKSARENSIDIIGISFHVGSHCHSAEPYLNTLKLSRTWWDELVKTFYFTLTTLDIGGGYPGERASKFREMATQINTAIQVHYGDIRSTIRIISEPGRYMVTSSQSIVVNVIAEKREEGKEVSYVLNTGVYGGLSTSIWDRTAARGSVPYILRKDNTGVKQLTDGYDAAKDGEKSLTLWGPTCDSSDRLIDGYKLKDIRRGDWIVFPNLGAYGSNIMTTFNGFQQPEIKFISTTLHSDKIRKLLDVHL